MTLRRLRMIAQIHRPHGDPNSAGLAVKKTSCSHKAFVRDGHKLRAVIIDNLTKGAPAEPTPLFTQVNANHQMTGRTESGRTIGSPGLQPNAAANCGRFDKGPLVLHCPGE